MADPAQLRPVIKGTGFIGDRRYVPWLIGHMANDEMARLASESFSMITGLALLYLKRKPPENFESAPNDDPEDEDVAMDEDDVCRGPTKNAYNNGGRSTGNDSRKANGTSWASRFVRLLYPCGGRISASAHKPLPFTCACSILARRCSSGARRSGASNVSLRE